MILFDRIKETASLRKLSLRELNEKAGLGTNAIYRWKEQIPSVDKIKKVADVLRVSVDYLLGETDDMTPSAPEKHIPDISTDDVFFFEGQEVDEDTMDYIRETLRRIKKNN